eukprot:8084500-Alexandrium_andersonii.AAC.1
MARCPTCNPNPKRPVIAAIRLSPQSAPPNMRNCFRRSELELREPRNGLEIALGKFRGMCPGSFSRRC